MSDATAERVGAGDDVTGLRPGDDLAVEGIGDAGRDVDGHAGLGRTHADETVVARVRFTVATAAELVMDVGALAAYEANCREDHAERVACEALLADLERRDCW